MGRIFISYSCPSPDAQPPGIWDVIKPDTYELQEGWIELTVASDNGPAALTPTVEAAVVNALQVECGQTSEAHGFKDDWHLAVFLEQMAEKMKGYQVWEITGDVDQKDTSSVEDKLLHTADVLRNNIIGTKLMLIVTELAEGMESLRHNNGVVGALDGEGNFGEELADAIVRILDTGTFTKDALGDQLLHKMAVNQGRPHMHGDKAM